jgi:hypothetical protein
MFEDQKSILIEDGTKILIGRKKGERKMLFAKS